MQSTFSGIEIGKRSLFAHQIGLTTIGHNISNASVDGYSRQQVELNAFHAIDRPQLNRAERAGQLGQGVIASRVARIRDNLLERRIVAQAGEESYWSTRDRYLLMLEQVYNEPSDLSVRGLMDRFWDAWQEISLHPSDSAVRRAVVQRGESLTEAIRIRHEELERIRAMLDDDVRGTVTQINSITNDIATLNRQIVNSQAAGNNPNDLLDSRDRLTERLSTLIDVTIDERDPDEFSIHSAGFHVVQGGIARPFAIVPDPPNEGFSRVVWAHSQEGAFFRGGTLAGIIELRDDDVRREIQKLDNTTINFTDLVNDIHRAGYGVNGRTGIEFFTEYPRVLSAQGNYDSDGDGLFDSSYIFRITGVNGLDPQQQTGLGGAITLPGADGPIVVEYAPTDTVGGIVARINDSAAEVVARLDRQQRLTLKATSAAEMENPDFVIRSLEDSGQFLVGYAGILTASGAAGAYDWQQADAVLGLRGDGLEYAIAPLLHPAGWITLNETIRQDHHSIAASFGIGADPGEPGNGEAALAIAALRNSPVLVGQAETFDDWFADTIAEVGLKGEQADLAFRTHEQIMKDLRDMRQSISGVNIDEEVAQMIKFQHGYTAAARFITNIDRMLDTIINRMGA